jgi:hypothetical protein
LQKQRINVRVACYISFFFEREKISVYVRLKALRVFSKIIDAVLLPVKPHIREMAVIASDTNAGSFRPLRAAKYGLSVSITTASRGAFIAIS